MSILSSLWVKIHNQSQIDFELFITACKEWLNGENNFTESRKGVSYRYIPDKSTTPGSISDVLRFLFGEDVEFSREGEAIPYLLTRLCAQALDPKKIDIRYIPEKCSALNDRNGISVNLSQDNMSHTCYHNILLVINNDGSWYMDIDGCWGGRDDGLGPTYYPEKYKYEGKIRRENTRYREFHHLVYLLWR